MLFTDYSGSAASCQFDLGIFALQIIRVSNSDSPLLHTLIQFEQRGVAESAVDPNRMYNNLNALN